MIIINFCKLNSCNNHCVLNLAECEVKHHILPAWEPTKSIWIVCFNVSEYLFVRELWRIIAGSVQLASLVLLRTLQGRRLNSFDRMAEEKIRRTSCEWTPRVCNVYVWKVDRKSQLLFELWGIIQYVILMCLRTFVLKRISSCIYTFWLLLRTPFISLCQDLFSHSLTWRKTNTVLFSILTVVVLLII